MLFALLYTFCLVYYQSPAGKTLDVLVQLVEHFRWLLLEMKVQDKKVKLFLFLEI